MTDESDWKFKMSLGKVPVVYLNSHVEFTRLVGGYNMVQNLMYSVPENRYDSFLKSFKETVAVKQEVKAVAVAVAAVAAVVAVLHPSQRRNQRRST